MLWDFYCPACDRTTEHWVSNKDEEVVCKKSDHSVTMTRCPGGTGMLYFEEGRGRTHWTLSDKPITSHAQHRKLMKEHGVVEAGNALPPRMKAKGITPKKEQMREIVAANKGRWF